MYRRKLRIKGNYFLLQPESWIYFIFSMTAHTYIWVKLFRNLWEPSFRMWWMGTSRLVHLCLWSQSIAFLFWRQSKGWSVFLKRYVAAISEKKQSECAMHLLVCGREYGKNLLACRCTPSSYRNKAPKVVHLHHESLDTVLCAALRYRTHSLFGF
jgi:hypothetical protein